MCIRDSLNNYYEYEIPLTFSDSMAANELIFPDDSFVDLEAYSNEVWRPENFIDFPLELFTDVKRARNNTGAPLTEVFSMPGINPDNPAAKVSIKGNPTLGLVKSLVIGVRNTGLSGLPSVSAEVWVNEMRLQGLNNRGGVAALARAELQMLSLIHISEPTRPY